MDEVEGYGMGWISNTHKPYIETIHPYIHNIHIRYVELRNEPVLEVTMGGMDEWDGATMVKGPNNNSSKVYRPTTSKHQVPPSS